jgi:putative transposase
MTEAGAALKQAMKVRAYPLPTFANKGKLARVHALLRPWHDALGGMQAQLHRQFLDGQPLMKRMPTKTNDLTFTTELSARQIKSVYNQTFQALNSWTGLVRNAVRELISGSGLDDETRIVLYRVNARKAWYAKELTLPVLVNTATREVRHSDGKPGNGWVKDELPVSAELLKLSRHMAKQVGKRAVSLPDLSRVNTMLMDGTIAQVEPSKNSSFDYWIRVSTLEKRDVAWIPLKAHKYFADAPGEVSDFVQLNVLKDGSLQFVLQKKSPIARPRPEGEYLGLDWGMKSVFATSDGRLFGIGAMPHLLELDRQAQDLAKSLQRQGIRPRTSKRYRNFQRRMREYIVNEVNRILNKLSREDLQGLVVEKLDARGGGMSRDMNRLVTRFGRGAIKKKLASLQEDTGLDIIEVNAAYTSKECSSCGHVHDGNRKGLKFHCRFCGMKTHADIDGARVVLSRRSWHTQSDSKTKSQRGTVRQRLDGAFKARWGCTPPTRGSTGHRKPGSRRRPAVWLATAPSKELVRIREVVETP